MRFVTAPEDWGKINAALEGLGRELHRAEPDRLKQLLRQSVAEYTPDLGDRVAPAPEPMPDTGPAVLQESELRSGLTGGCDASSQKGAGDALVAG